MARLQETRTAFRRPTNVSLDERLVADAKELGINVSRACEVGLHDEIRAERSRRWKEANREANAAYIAYLEKYGVPLAEYRRY